MSDSACDQEQGVTLWFAAAAARLLPTKARVAIYRIPLLSSLLRGILNRGVPTGITAIQIAGGPLKGMWIKLDLKDEKYYWLGNYEPQLLDAIPVLCKPGMCVFDIGANAGYTTLAFAKYVGDTGTVVAFEPLPCNARRIAESARLNRMEQRIRVVEAAVSNSTAAAKFATHMSRGMGKLSDAAGRDESYEETIEVETLTLDSFVDSEQIPPDLIKIDIEGGGVLLAEGVRNVLRQHRPIVVAELHGPEEREAIIGVLEANDYSVRLLAAGLPPFDKAASQWKSHIVGLPTQHGRLS